MEQFEEKVSRADFVYTPKVKPLTEVTAKIDTHESRELVAKILENYLQ